MSEVTKDQMLMRADDIEDILNDVFSRHMPDLQPGEELGMGFDGMDAETVYNKLKGEAKLKKSLKRLTKHVYREYGARCDEYEPTCIVCKTWACIDHLKETIKLKGETK